MKLLCFLLALLFPGITLYHLKRGDTTISVLLIRLLIEIPDLKYRPEMLLLCFLLALIFLWIARIRLLIEIPDLKYRPEMNMEHSWSFVRYKG